MNQIAKTSKSYRVSLNGESVVCTEDDFETVCDDLVKRHGGGIPEVRELGPAKVATVVQLVDSGAARQAVAVDLVDGVSQSGAARAARDEATARANGFVVADPMFQLGTRVNELGVENAARSQMEHDEKPWAQDVCRDLVTQVRAEQRNDFPAVRLAQLRMSTLGDIAIPNTHRVFGISRLPITDRMFSGLMGRFPCASGIAYLNDCTPELRAINFNHWARQLETIELGAGDKAKEVVLRTRLVGGVRAGYAAVSQKYTAFDADRIGEALAMAFPSDAKGVLDYDGERVRVEGLWHSDVKPEEFVAGEIFKAGVIVKSDDTGAGSIRVQSVVWRNLCQNLIILDRAIGVDVRLRHRGTTTALAASFRKAFGQALSSVNAFRTAWTAARREQGRTLVESVQGTTRDDLVGLPVEAVLPGIFNGVLKRDLVPVRGRADAVVPKLLEMHRQDEAAAEYGVSRASIVNAFTRYAHQVETDPFQADRIREGAGSLLSGTRGKAPAPLPYLAFAS